jgi:hypothetical protein
MKSSTSFCLAHGVAVVPCATHNPKSHSTVFNVEPNFGCCSANFNQVQLCCRSLLAVDLRL